MWPRPSLYGGPGWGQLRGCRSGPGHADLLSPCPAPSIPPSPHLLMAEPAASRSGPPGHLWCHAQKMDQFHLRAPNAAPGGRKCSGAHTPRTHTQHVHRAWACTPGPAQTGAHTRPTDRRAQAHHHPPGVPVPPGWAQVLLVPWTSLSLTVQGVTGVSADGAAIRTALGGSPTLGAELSCSKIPPLGGFSKST